MTDTDQQELAFAQLTPDKMLDCVETTGIQCDGRFLTLNSYENRVFQVYTESEDRVVAKFYRPHRWSDEQILEEHQFTAELDVSELPVVAPLKLDTASTLFHVSDYRFAIFPYRGGRQAELDNPDHLFQLGRFVGRMHGVASSAKFNTRPAIDPDGYLFKPSAFLLKNQFVPDYLVESYSSTIDHLKLQVANCYDSAGNFQNIRLHGDFHWGNILWTESGPLVVDFDDCRTGPAIQDLWLFLSGDRNYMQQGLMELLEGYEEFCDFNPRELHLIEALRTLRLVYHAAWLASRWNDPAFPRAFPWFNSDRFWQEHILNLKEQSALLAEEPIQISTNR